MAQEPGSLVEIPVELDTIVDGRAVIHEFALDGDESLDVGAHVALVNDGVSIAAVVTEIDADSYLHLALLPMEALFA